MIQLQARRAMAVALPSRQIGQRGRRTRLRDSPWVQGLGRGCGFPANRSSTPAYIVTQLQAWPTGTRKNDPMGLMHGIALKLTAADIGAVAAYYGGLDAVPSTKRSVKP